jgi:hypothetical protein
MIEREPYENVEYPSKRAYILTKKQQPLTKVLLQVGLDIGAIG